MPNYNFTLPDVEPDKLHQEVADALPSGYGSAITINDYVGASDTVVVEVASGLSSGEEAQLQSVIDNHDPYAHLRIFDYLVDGSAFDAVDHAVPPHELNYETGLKNRLHRVVESTFGEVRQVKYMDPEDLTTTVICEDIAYTRDGLGFASERTTFISWIDVNGRMHPKVKTLKKTYTPVEALREGKRRRGNILDEIMMDMGGLIAMTELIDIPSALALGRSFLRDHKTSVDMFIDASDPTILGEIKHDAVSMNDWLDNDVPGAPSGYTIRRYVFDAVNIYITQGVTWDDF